MLSTSSVIRFARFHPHTAHVAVANDDYRVQIWGALSGECLQVDELIWLIDADAGRVLTTFRPPGLYEDMNITGISAARCASLQALGAVEG